MILTLPAHKYDQIQEIARGGMGIVFKAHHKHLHRWTAVKVLYPHLAADTGFIERFRREARTMARLDHDGIIRIYDVEPGEETYSLVMEYVEGRDLKRLAATKGMLGADEVVAVSIQVGEALAYAHSQGVIHRDIKPGNIMLGTDHRVKVGDFGIAAALDEMSLTTSGQLLGTPDYMAPEQLHGGPPDGRTDLYALGMTMAALLMGHAPFVGQSRAAILAELTSLAPHALDFPPTISPNLQAVIRRLISRRPADRYQGAEELVEELKGLAGMHIGVAESLPAPSVPEPAPASGGGEAAGDIANPTEDLRAAETQPVVPLPRAARWSRMSVGLGQWKKKARPMAAVVGLLVIMVGAVWALRSMGPHTTAVLSGPGPPEAPQSEDETVRVREAKDAPEVTHGRMKVAREAAETTTEGGRRLAAPPESRQAAQAITARRAPEPGAGVGNDPVAAPPVQAEPAAIPSAPAVAALPQPRPADEPGLEDIEAVTARLEAVRSAAATRSLGAVRDVLDLAPESEQMFVQLFRDYQEIRMAVGQVQIGRGAATARLTFERLVNQAGQEVVPAESWRQMRVVLEKHGGAWGRPRW